MKFSQLTWLCFFILSFSFCIAQNGNQSKVDSIQQLPNDSAKLQAWLNLSKSYRTTNYAFAETYADSAIELAEELGLFNTWANALGEKGRAAMRQSNYDVATESYNKALAYYDSSGQLKKKAIILNNLSVVKRDQALFDESMTYLFESLEISEEIADSTGIANAFTNIAVVYAIKQEYARAEEYFLKAMELWKSLGNERNQNTILLNLGGLLMEDGQYQKSLEYLNDARIYFETNGPLTELGRTHYVLGNVYLGMKELDKSEGNYLIAKGIFEQIGNNMRATGCLLRLSSVAEERRNIDKAIGYAKDAYDRNTAMGVGNMTIRSLHQLVNLYEKREDYKTALNYHKELTSLKDSIDNSERDAQIIELEEKYKSEVRERELAKTRADLELQELKLKRKEVQQRILYGLVIAGLIILLLLWNQFRTKQKTNELLKEKNALIEKSLGEKEVLLKEIHHRVKNNLQFISSLFNLQARHVKDDKALEILQEGKNRIQSMALVHQKLYQEENLKGVDMAEYLANLMDSLKHSYKATSDKVTVKTTVDAMRLDIDTAMPIGLIVNELATNAFKYAFSEAESGKLEVSLISADDHLELKVSDNGVGLPEDLDTKNPKKFGMRLVRSLAEKLGSEPLVESNNGMLVRLAITNYKTDEV